MNRKQRTQNNYDLLVFDWDGTLIDSIDGIVSSLQIASRAVGAERVSEQDARSVIGLGLREAIEALHPGLRGEHIDRIADAYRQHYLYENPIEACLFDGVREMLDLLRDSGYQLAIATGKSRAGLDRVLEAHDLAGYFSATRCAGESRSKPHPDMLLEILGLLQVQAQQTLMIGDSTHDMQMANNASVDAIAVTRGVNTAEDLMLHNPLCCLDHITDLAGFLSHNTRGCTQDAENPAHNRTDNQETEIS